MIKGVQNWNVANGDNFSRIFYKCKSLKDIKAIRKLECSK